MAKAIPDGFHTLTPHLICKDAAKAMDWYKKAFGAVEKTRHAGPDGKLMHGSFVVGNSMVMIADEFPDFKCLGPQSIGGTPVTLHLYVEDVDSVYKRAITAGAKETMPVQDQFWGDRYGQLVDPFGHSWSVATHKKDMSDAELAKAGKEAMASMECQ